MICLRVRFPDPRLTQQHWQSSKVF